MSFLHSKRRLLIAVFDIALLIFGFFIRNIALFIRSVVPTCFFLQRGYLCHACGGTRCVYYFFSGRFDIAFSYNPFVFLLILYVFCAIIFLNLMCLTDKEFPKRAFLAMVDPKTVIAIVVSFVLFGLVRHLILM